MSVLVFAEHDNAELKVATLNVVTAAAQLDADIHVVVTGQDCAAVAGASVALSCSASSRTAIRAPPRRS